MAGVVTGRVMSGYLGAPRGDRHSIRDEVVMRSAGSPPAMIRRLRLGDVGCCVFEGTDVEVCPHRWRPSRDGIVIGYLADGAVHVAQDEREVALRPGQLVFYDSVTPYRVRADVPHRFLIAHVRWQALRVRMADRDAVVARELSAIPATVPLAAMLGTIADGRADPAAAASVHLGDAVVAAVHAVVADVRGAVVSDRSARLFHELTQWLDAHLADRELSPDVLAARHFLSQRYIRKVFADHGTTVLAYVRRQRLVRIRDELLDPGCADEPVSAVAARWGFTDPSVFTRAFTREFGQGPQSFRREAGPRPDIAAPRE